MISHTSITWTREREGEREGGREGAIITESLSELRVIKIDRKYNYVFGDINAHYTSLEYGILFSAPILIQSLFNLYLAVPNPLISNKGIDDLPLYFL